MTRLFAAASLTVALFATLARAQAPTTVTTEPPWPSDATDVTVVVFTPCGCPVYPDDIVRDGFVLNIPADWSCVSVCLPTITKFDAGRLAPGSYTVRRFDVRSTTYSETIGTFVVNQSIPVFGATALVLLSVTLAVIAALTLRGR